MEANQFIFNGKRFKYLEDFEQEFRPTKWSIRKFMNFIDDFEYSEKMKFSRHTIDILSSFYTPDKDTINFIRQIEEKRESYFGKIQYWDDEFNHEHSSSVKVPKEKYNKLIRIMVMLQKDGIIQGSTKDIAEMLIKNFGVKYSLSTITTKMYEFSGELKEENINKETFKNFHSLLNNI